MSKKEQDAGNGTDLLAQVLARTTKNVVKKRSGSGRSTYLDRFVDVLTDDKGNPVAAKSRTQIIAEISFQIIKEKMTESGKESLDLTDEGNSEDDLLLADINKKVKAQVASAIANNQNSTSISYNESYKDKWEVSKEGGLIALVAKKSAE